MITYTTELKRLAGVLLLSNGLSVFLFGLRIAATGNYRYWFLLWNLVLAWMPVVFASLAVKCFGAKRRGIGAILVVLWLLFLPNSFYLLSDLVHLRSTGEITILFDAVLMFSFIINGFIAGYISVYLIHRQLAKQVMTEKVMAILAGVFLLCGYAIYLGRELRWNSWDVLTNPAGLLFDVTQDVLNPLAHPQALLITLTFFLLLAVTYAVIYEVFRVVGPLYSRKR